MMTHPIHLHGMWSDVEDSPGRFFFFQAEDGIRDLTVTGVQTCALPIYCWPSKCVGETSDPGLYHAPHSSTTSLTRCCRSYSPMMVQCWLISDSMRSASRRSEEHTSELQSQSNLVCRLLLEKKKKKKLIT